MALSEMQIYRVLQCKTPWLDFQCGLMDDDIDELINLLSKRKDIHEVHLNQNNLTDKSIFKLIKLTWITNFDFERNNIGNSGALALIACPHLDRVNLDASRSITDETWEIISENTLQSYLGVEGNNISEKFAKKITQHTALNQERKNQKNLESKNSTNTTDSTPANTPSTSKKESPSSSYVEKSLFRKDSGSDSEGITFHEDNSDKKNNNQSNQPK